MLNNSPISANIALGWAELGRVAHTQIFQLYHGITRNFKCEGGPFPLRIIRYMVVFILACPHIPSVRILIFFGPWVMSNRVTR